MNGVLVIFGLIIIGFIVFVIYFIFKQLQFVIMSVNLYKKMVNRQDAMVKLLIDIRDNTKHYDSNLGSVTASQQEEDTFVCENCNAEVPSNAKKCPKCGAQFE